MREKDVLFLTSVSNALLELAFGHMILKHNDFK